MQISFSQVQNKKGFTFVEVLVVLSIVGILAAAGLVAALQSRDNAKERDAIAQFGLIQIEAELSYKRNVRTFRNVCADIQSIRDEIDMEDEQETCLDGRDGFAYEIEFASDSFYCVDARGKQLASEASTISDAGECDASATAPADCTCG